MVRTPKIRRVNEIWANGLFMTPPIGDGARPGTLDFSLRRIVHDRPTAVKGLRATYPPDRTW